MANLIFSRRDIARALTTVSDVLGAHVARGLARRIDRNDRVPAVWEALILAASLSETDFEHERKLANGRKPDLLFSLESNEGSFSVYGDVGAVSDAGRETENPVNWFYREFYRRLKAANLGDMAFDVRVDHDRALHAQGGRAVLKLGRRDQLERFLKRVVIPRLRDWKRDKRFPKEVFKDGPTSITITRKPDGSSGSGRHACQRRSKNLPDGGAKVGHCSG